MAVLGFKEIQILTTNEEEWSCKWYYGKATKQLNGLGEINRLIQKSTWERLYTVIIQPLLGYTNILYDKL